MGGEWERRWEGVMGRRIMGRLGKMPGGDGRREGEVEREINENGQSTYMSLLLSAVNQVVSLFQSEIGVSGLLLALMSVMMRVVLAHVLPAHLLLSVLRHRVMRLVVLVMDVVFLTVVMMLMMHGTRCVLRKKKREHAIGGKNEEKGEPFIYDARVDGEAWTEDVMLTVVAGDCVRGVDVIA